MKLHDVHHGSRRGRGTRGAGLALALLVAGLPAAADAQQPSDTPQPPPFFAIQNARIVTVSGPVIESGTVVISFGLIEAVGSNVLIPAEAWVIDGSGMTVYPGLFDGLSSLGLEQAQTGGDQAGGPGGVFGGGNQPISEGPEDRPATTPWVSAADMLDPEDNRLATWREGGFTTALTVPDEGIVTGQAAVISLGGDAQEMIVKTPAALHVTMNRAGGFRSFPSSLMGTIAYVKQLYADARHQSAYEAAYEANPAGRARPKYDRALAPVQQSIADGWPTVFLGNEVKEIRRAVKLGEDTGARAVVAGAHEAYEIADELAASGVPVLVNLDWPERSRSADPEADEALTSLRRRAYAPTTPARLHAAGATFAFYSGDLGSPREVIENVNVAIEKGLPADAALRALTLGPAEIFGVADRLGSIDAGKIANLIVTDGDLFDESTKVKMVFVDGRKFEEREAERPTAPPTVDMTGRWVLTISTPRQTQEITLDLEMSEDGTLTGDITTDRGDATIIDGWVSGDEFGFTAMQPMGGRTAEVVYTGTVEDTEVSGTASFGGRFSSEFTGTRPGEGQ
jgi:imidazolonepropionase-like amidohydrolase